MSRNGTGIYSLPAGNPVLTNTVISSTWANTTLSDIANALTQSVSSDGQTTMVGALNMGTYQINNMADPALPQDAVTLNYLSSGTYNINGGTF